MNLIFEYCPKGALDEAISKRHVSAGEDTVCRFVYQLLDALRFLKEQRILHRDVRPANMLLANEAVMKLADFGVACFVTEPLKSHDGTPAFFPPEMHQLP